MSTQAGQTLSIDAAGMYYRALNARLQEACARGATRVELRNIQGQRYIGTNLRQPVDIEIWGTPGNDLGAFMDGPRITVHGNAQDGCGNTMNSGEIIIHGRAGDIVGLSARGGRIFVRDGAGYRAGIHMKEYGEQKPVLVIGGTAQDFFGEYLAGGIIALLGLSLGEGEHHRASFIGTGMHGGVIYIRGGLESHQLGREVGIADLDDQDWQALRGLVAEYAEHFGMHLEHILRQPFVKLYPKSVRPYGRLYAY